MRKILITLALLIFATPVFADSSIYTDVRKNSPYYDILLELHQKGIMIGYADGTFKPNQYVRRNEYSETIVKALGLDKKMVVSGVEFYDLPVENSYYDAMQIALYYDFLPLADNSKYIYPNGTIIRKYAIFSVVNYLSDKVITVDQAKNILGKYKDRGTLKNDDLIEFAKADIMGILPVVGNEVKINATRPLTRAELAVMVYGIFNEEYNMYNKKIEHYGAKKKAIGSRIKQAYVKGDYAIIPVQTEIPVQMTTKADSQKSQVDDVQKAVVPWNLITKERYLLIKAGSKIELEVKDVQKRKFLRRNGELRVESTKISTPFNQTAAFPAVLIVNDKIGLGNKIFKFKRIRTTKSEKSYLKLLQDVKVDLTSGLFVNEKL